MRAASPPRQMERENEMIVISHRLFFDGDGNIAFHWLLSDISAILNASHCNSSHENRDKKEVPYGFHHYLLWFCRSKHDRALSLQMA